MPTASTTCVLRDVIIIPDNKGAARSAGRSWSSWVGVWWDTPPNPADPSSRSDVLYFDNVCINCNSAPGTGVLWDGMTNTFIINYANILNGAYGFRVINSRHDKHYLVPQFLNAFALLIENAAIDLSIETGCEFKITTSDMDMCKENTVQILPGSGRLADGLRADHEFAHRELPKDRHRNRCQGRQHLQHADVQHIAGRPRQVSRHRGRPRRTRRVDLRRARGGAYRRQAGLLRRVSRRRRDRISRSTT